MYVYRSAKTGRIVTEAYALKNPDTTVREKVKVTEAPEPPHICKISIGEIARFSKDGEEFLAEIACYEPLEIIEHFVLDGVHATAVKEIALKGWTITPLTRTEVIEHLY